MYVYRYLRKVIINAVRHFPSFPFPGELTIDNNGVLEVLNVDPNHCQNIFIFLPPENGLEVNVLHAGERGLHMELHSGGQKIRERVREN